MTAWNWLPGCTPEAIRHLAPAAAFFLIASMGDSLPGQELGGDKKQPNLAGVGMLSCASASCHGQSVDEAFPQSTARQEYVLWLEDDPHAKAVRTLDSPEFKRILAIVSSGRAEGEPSAAVYRRCAECHDPQGLAHGGKNDSSLVRAPVSQGTRGIGCESCHGPADNWLTAHYQGDRSRSELSALGIVDTKDELVRARQCAACHVGDAARDVNHDMIAAGHPPLRFELSAYHDLIRRKHWSDAERIERPGFKAHLWAAGQIATAEATADLLESRSRRAAAGDHLTPWPEFAEFDCHACHRRLRPITVDPQRHDQRRLAGNPRWQPWNRALVVRFSSEQRDEPQLITDPADAQRQAAQFRLALRQAPLTLALAMSRSQPAGSFSTAQLLALIDQPQPEEGYSWAVACHELLALKAAYLAMRDQNEAQLPSGALGLNTENPDLVRQASSESAVHRDLDDIATALRFGSSDYEWPAFDWQGLPPAQRLSSPKLGSLTEIHARIRRLAAELRQTAMPEVRSVTLTPGKP